MFALIKWGLWQRRAFIVWWCVAIIGLVFVNLVFYPSFKQQSAQLEQSLSQIPDSAKAFISDTGDFASPTGYLSSQVFYLMLPMLLGILSISLGSSLIGKEEREGTIELLLSRPISRSKLLFAKALIGITITLIASSAGVLTAVIMAKIVDLEVPLVNILMAGLSCFIIALCFGAVAFMFASFGKARSASIGIATFVALGGYIIASLKGVVTWLKYPSYGLPFNYYNPGSILKGQFEWPNMILLLTVIIILGLISWVSFRKRDIVG